MNWEAIGASGEVIGAVAVVLTLIYLSVQLRQNTRSSELAALQGFFDATSALNRDRGKLEAGLLRAGLSDWHSLANNDKAKLDAYFADFASQIHRGYRLHQKGILDEETYSTWEASLIALLNEPGGAVWWSSMSKIWPQDFQERLQQQSESHTVKLSELMPWYSSDSADTTR